MRIIDMNEWCAGGRTGARKKIPKGRPTSDWKLRNSIIFIKRRDEYLQKEGILVRTGRRSWRLNLK